MADAKVLVTKEAISGLLKTIKENIYNWDDPETVPTESSIDGQFCLATEGDISKLFNTTNTTNS